MGLRLSQLEDKSKGRLKSMKRKHHYRIDRLKSILREADSFGIPLSVVTENAVRDKIDYYRRELYKIANVYNYKYVHDYKGGLDKLADKWQ